MLKTELREFQAEYAGVDHADPQVWGRLNAKIVRMPERVIIASQTFESRYAAGGQKMGDIIFAFEDALNKVLKKIRDLDDGPARLIVLTGDANASSQA